MRSSQCPFVSPSTRQAGKCVECRDNGLPVAGLAIGSIPNVILTIPHTEKRGTNTYRQTQCLFEGM